MCVYDKHPLASREIQYPASKSWSEYTTTQQARAGRNIYFQPVCYFLKNTTIPCKEYLQYPMNTTYNISVVHQPLQADP